MEQKSIDRWKRKADAFVSGWRAEFNGAEPSFNAVILALSVAQHETHCGDSWPGPDGLLGTEDDENNWGATTLRALNAAEKAVLVKAGLVPTVGAGHVQRAKDAMTALKASGLPLPQGVIHCDSAPAIGPYFVYFASFPTESLGAAYFVHLLCKNGKRPAYTVLMHEGSTEQDLATAMYKAGYYTGFNDPKLPGGAQKNIDAYASSLRTISPGIRAALVGWKPSPPKPEEPPKEIMPEPKQEAPIFIGPEPVIKMIEPQEKDIVVIKKPQEAGFFALISKLFSFILSLLGKK